MHLVTVVAMPNSHEISDPLNPSASSGGACAKMSPCGKSCIACSICAVVVGAIMAPIGILVIGPAIAQGILDKTVITLPNSTMNPCTGLFALVSNNAILDVPSMGLPSTLLTFNQSLYTTTCLDETQQPPAMNGGWNCKNASKTLLGTYMSPSMDLVSGKNTKNFSVGMDLSTSTIIVSGFVVPLFLANAGARMILEATVSISVFGIKFHGLKMNNVLTCHKGKDALGGFTPPYPIPNSVCYPQLNHSASVKQPVDNNPGYFMSCVAGESSLDPPPTTTPPPAITQPKRTEKTNVV